MEVKELLPFAIGFASGSLSFLLRRRRHRLFATLLVALAGGACVSAVNGELEGGLWPFFVSVDAALVYLGVGLGATATALLAPRIACSVSARRKLPLPRR